MYLTELEFSVLKGIKEGLGFQQIAKSLNKSVKETMIAAQNLFAKYGASHKVQLIQKVDFNKIKVCPIEKMPYYYNKHGQVAQLIYIKKKHIKKLVEYFKGIEDENAVCKISYLPYTGCFEIEE